MSQAPRSVAIDLSPPTHDDTVWMARALELAAAAAGAGEIPVGALVVRGEEIVSEGHNRTVTDADPSAHAEIVAIRHAGSALGVEWARTRPSLSR